METEKVKDKIAKLLAMAHDGRGNEFEAEAALRQAEKLMRKHGIDAALLQDRTGQKPVYNWKRINVPAGRPDQPAKRGPIWFGWLITAIGRFTDTKVSYTYDLTHGVCAEFAGDEVDVEYAVWLCKHLRDNARRQSGEFAGDRSGKISFKRAFILRVCERMDILRRERDAAMRDVKTSTGTALIVVNQKIALRDAEFGKQLYGRSGTYSLNSLQGAAAGRVAGDRASLGRPLSGNGSTKRIGG